MPKANNHVKPASSAFSILSSGPKYNKTVEESMNLVKQKSMISMRDFEEQKRNESIISRNMNDIKLVANDENRSAYPQPGTGYSTKLGGTWKINKASRNILTETEVYDVINTALETQEFEDDYERERDRRKSRRSGKSRKSEMNARKSLRKGSRGANK